MNWSKASFALEQLSTTDAVWARAVTCFEEAGFGAVIYLSSTKSRCQTVLRTNVPQLYEGMEPGDDPFLEYCCHSYEITRTGPAYLSDHDYLPEVARAFVARIATYGFLTGYGIPVRLEGAARFGGFIVGTPLSVAEFEARYDDHVDAIRAYCLVLHRRLEELGSDGQLLLNTLSPRERDVISHVIEGATRKEIARTLELSPNTVAEYTKSAYRKLDARNKAEVIRKLTT